MSRPLSLALIALALALPLAACGGGSSSDKPASSGASGTSSAPTPSADEAVTQLADSISKDTKKKPVVAITEGATPTKRTV